MIDKETRSWIMSQIRGRGTKPELEVAALLREINVPFEWQPDMEGRPDFLLRSGVAVFINGCFWHGCPRHYREPRSNVEFWRNKIGRNRERQGEVIRALRKKGFDVLVVWEHSIRDGSYRGRMLRLADRERKRKRKRGRGRLLRG